MIWDFKVGWKNRKQKTENIISSKGHKDNCHIYDIL